ncbi:MAG: class I SAM-dependent methyltransferase [Eubacteriales bacterium]|jgi:tRNA (adenine22-N1)-methyltransferase|nr:class I SAM-dependent methyltransferase [Eubacteriales bacterium]
MTLTNRLQAVADMVFPCDVAADIGTDHAYIPIYLLQKGIIKRAIASDVATGPAEIARENVKKYALEDKIDVVVGDGLEKIEHADIIIIAGMGGKLICDILKKGEGVAKSAKLLILQPMTMADVLRRYLHKEGFAICDETLAKEGGKLYNIMAVKAGTEKFDNDIYYYIGKALVQKAHPLLGEFLRRKIYALDRAIANMKNSSQDADKYHEFIERRKAFLEVYNDYNS